MIDSAEIHFWGPLGVCWGWDLSFSHAWAISGVERQVVTCFWRWTPTCNLFLALNARLQHGTGVERQFTLSIFAQSMNYYILLEIPGCLLSNAVGSASFGVLQLELYSVEGAEVSWPHCRLPPCSCMLIAGQFSPSILVSTMQCHICLESSWFLLSNASWITSFGAL